MKVSGRNVSMIRGDSEVITISCTDAYGGNAPLVEGDTVYFTIKETIHDEEKVFQKIITDFTDGKAIVRIRPEDTKNLSFKTYVYDTQISGLDGTVTTIVPPSDFKICGEVTYE